jgi:hypothetical protein
MSLFLVAFIAIALLQVLKPREMTSYAIKSRTGTDQRIEPTETRILITRIIGVVAIIFALMMFFQTGFGF